MAKSAGNHITSCRIFWENTDDILEDDSFDDEDID